MTMLSGCSENTRRFVGAPRYHGGEYEDNPLPSAVLPVWFPMNKRSFRERSETGEFGEEIVCVLHANQMLSPRKIIVTLWGELLYPTFIRTCFDCLTISNDHSYLQTGDRCFKT